MGRLTLMVILALGLAGCARPSRTGSIDDRIKYKVAPANPPAPLTPSETRVQDPGVHQMVTSTYHVAEPDSMQITGQCRHYSSVKTIEVPCQNVRVVLKDSDGKTVVTATVENGEFALSPPHSKTYFLSVDSARYRLKSAKPVKVAPGDKVILDLVPVPGS